MYGSLGNVNLINNTDIPLENHNTTILFTQGLAQLYGFNLVESLRNFKTTTLLSPNCALCHWGVAMSFAPNINYIIENQTKFNIAANTALLLANSQHQQLSFKTRWLIKATSKLIAPANHKDSSNSIYRRAFSNAMCAPHFDDPSDPDIDAFCASSLMSLSPWNYYQGIESGQIYPLKTYLVPAKMKLLGAVHRGPKTTTKSPHVFAIHLLIHLLEPTNAPLSYKWQALEPTELLFKGGNTSNNELVPAQGHLTHMPAHLFLRVGKYNDAVQTSTISTSDNIYYITKCLQPYGHGHNLKMYVANARMAGRLNDALAKARLATLPDAGTEISPNGNITCIDCAGPGSPEVILTLLRFGKFAKVLNESLPLNNWGTKLYLPAYNKAAWRYARAAAYWALSNHGQNKTRLQLGDQEAIQCLVASKIAYNPHRAMNYTIIFPEQLAAARAAHIDQNWTEAIRHLRNVVHADDVNEYLEPPRVWYPPRECLGALLLKVGNATAALKMFENDLETFVDSGWSLYGAAAAAKILGMKGEWKIFQKKGDIAWNQSDVEFVSACPELLS